MAQRKRKGLLAGALAGLLAISAGGIAGTAQAADRVSLELNWTPTADHSPFYYALSQGWYSAAGIDLEIDVGRGSEASAQRVATGASDLGIADLPTAMQVRGKGGALNAIMVIYANSPQGFYWLKSSGITGPVNFAGKRLGNPPGDAGRLMWPAFAKKVGIDPNSVHFVNISPQAKEASLKSHAVDIVSDFYNEHDVKIEEFGPDLGYLGWRNVGLNMYGNGIVVNSQYLAAHPDAVKKFIQVTQRAYAACVRDAAPCLKALMTAASGLNVADQEHQWNRIKELMRDPTTTSVALGAMDEARMKGDYALVSQYVGIETPFDVRTFYTNGFLDKSIKMPSK